MVLPKRNSILWRIVFRVYDSLVSRHGILAIAFLRSRLDWDRHVKSWIKDFPVSHVSVADPLCPEFQMTHSFSERYTWELSDALLSMRTGEVFLGGNNVFDASSWGYNRKTSQWKPRPIRQRTIREPVVFVRPYRWNYYHWLIDELPAILRARQHSPDAKVLLPAKTPHYVHQSLEAYGISPHRIEAKWVYATNLVLAARGQDAGWPHGQDVRLLRESLKVQARKETVANKKLYLSRARSRRGFPNEREVEALAASRGFEPTYLEELSFIEQVNLFREATHIVGLHGSGLANMVFSQNGTKVRELSPRNTAHPMFEVLAHTCQHNYERIVIESEGIRDLLGCDLSDKRLFSD